MYRLPGLVLDLLGDDSPSVMRLLDTGSDRVMRPLPGMHLLIGSNSQTLCRHEQTPSDACTESQQWLEAVVNVTRDLFGGDQRLLRLSKSQTALALVRQLDGEGDGRGN
jgi:hypothetical protein